MTKKFEEPMTSEMYLARGGCRCPVCRSADIEGGAVDIDWGYAHQEVTCAYCGATWFDTYKLTGYTVLCCRHPSPVSK